MEFSNKKEFIMSGITFISRDFGVNVSIVRLTTTDNTATATAANYITNQLANIAAANDAVGSSTPFSWFANDCILLSASDGLSFCSINSTFTTLSELPTLLAVQSGIVAHAGGGQTLATQLNAGINVIATAATTGDSVILPAQVQGQFVLVENGGASSVNVYPASGDTINGGSANAPVALAAGAFLVFYGDSLTNWLEASVSLPSNVVLTNAPNTFTGTGSIILPKVNGTEASNAVTASGVAGDITTSSLTTAGGSSYAITWTNTTITATSVVLLTLNGGTNTTENFTMKVVPGSGTATLTIYNNTAATALNGTLIIGYAVL
jgi:hypothetical protein